MNENFINNYEYYKNISLQKYNTYRLDVKCGYLIYPKDVEELIKLLKYFVDVDEKWIPCNSLLKEFIGGSCYRDSTPIIK